MLSQLAGWWYFLLRLQIRAVHGRFVRGRPNEEVSVAELLSEHGFAGKCSTSHVLGPRGLGSGSGLPAAARSHSCRRAPVTHQATHLEGTLRLRSRSREFSRTRGVHEQVR